MIENTTPDLMKLFDELVQQPPALTPREQALNDLTTGVLQTLRDAGFAATNTPIEGRVSGEILLQKDAYQQKFVLSVTESVLGGLGKTVTWVWCSVDGERDTGQPFGDIQEVSAAKVAEFMVTKMAVRNRTPRAPVI